ncbi:MAG: AraC family transcriptional regulator, partial [Pseudomonas sp.]
MEQKWQGEVWLARDYALFAGRNGDTRAHAHYAHQWVQAQAGPVHMQLAGQPVSAECVFIPSMHEHAFVDAEQPVLVLFAEPLAYNEQQLRHALPTLDALAAHMASLPRRQLDPRIERALAELDSQLHDKVSAQQLAYAASLSLSQLERLFADQVGLSVRRLVLWRRLYLAMSLALQGQALTDAAHGAGFADSAHLSRSMRTLLGIRADLSLPHLRLRLL